jgi:hypothetical protein
MDGSAWPLMNDLEGRACASKIVSCSAQFIWHLRIGSKDGSETAEQRLEPRREIAPVIDGLAGNGPADLFRTR